MTIRTPAAAHRGAALLLALVVAVGTAALAVMLDLRRHDLVPLPAIAPFDGDLRWTATSVDPASQQRAAAAALLDWLVVVAGTAVAMAAIGVLTLWAQQASLRAQEIAIHRAIGASRRSLLVRSLREGALIGLAGGLAGATLASFILWTTTGTRSSTASLWPGWLVLVGATIGGALFPLWAARTRRIAEADDPEPPLGIAAVQLGAALAILVTASLLTRHADRSLDPAGHDTGPAGTLTTLAWSPVDPLRRSAEIRALVDRLSESGGTASVTTAGAHQGLGTIDNLITDCGRCYVGGIFLKWRPLRATYQTATADTFDARGVRLVEGRAFTLADDLGAEPVAIVNLHLARRYFEGGRAIGRLLYPTGRMTGAHRVVGIVSDDRAAGFGGGAAPLETIYLSTLQHPPRVTEILASSAQAPLAVPATARVLERESFAALTGRRDRVIRWFGRWFGTTGGAVLFLAVVGTASLLGLWVRALGPELAVRRAVGARRSRIVLMVLGRTLRTAAAGIGIGLAFFGPALWSEVARLVSGIEAWNGGAVGRSAAVLVAVAVAAAVIPAVRAAGASPAALWSRR